MAVERVTSLCLLFVAVVSAHLRVDVLESSSVKDAMPSSSNRLPDGRSAGSIRSLQLCWFFAVRCRWHIKKQVPEW